MPDTANPKQETLQLAEQIQTIRDDLAKLTSLLKDMAASTATDGAKTLHDEADHLLHRTRQAAEIAADKARGAAGSIETQIAEKPIQSALIALLIGLVIGSLGRR